MSLFDKIKSVFPSNDYDDYDEYEDYEYDVYEEESESTDAYSSSEPTYKQRREERSRRTTENKSEQKGARIVNFGSNGTSQVVITKPLSFDEARSIGDHLNMKKTVVLNLETTPENEAHRLFDFLSGAAYANSCGFKKIANRTFLITPSNVDVSGDAFLEEIESGFYAY